VHSGHSLAEFGKAALMQNNNQKGRRKVGKSSHGFVTALRRFISAAAQMTLLLLFLPLLLDRCSFRRDCVLIICFQGSLLWYTYSCFRGLSTLPHIKMFNIPREILLSFIYGDNFCGSMVWVRFRIRIWKSRCSVQLPTQDNHIP
jgi:hypothetical protein